MRCVYQQKLLLTRVLIDQTVLILVRASHDVVVLYTYVSIGPVSEY